MYGLVVKARGLEYGGHEAESRSLHLKPETKLCDERGLSGCWKGLKTVPLAQVLLSPKPAKTNNTVYNGSHQSKFVSKQKKKRPMGFFFRADDSNLISVLKLRLSPIYIYKFRYSGPNTKLI